MKKTSKIFSNILLLCFPWYLSQIINATMTAAGVHIPHVHFLPLLNISNQLVHTIALLWESNVGLYQVFAG